MKFKEFPKMARFSREIIISEKIDGTNASIFIQPKSLEFDEESGLKIFNDEKVIAELNGYTMRVGSRTKWITPKDDNYGFANWALKNSEELFKLGEGHHFGEWWGNGIQRGYNLSKGEKRFSLFNVSRWEEGNENTPKCCHVVPTLWTGIMNTDAVNNVIEDLRINGSYANKGYMNPEGVVIFHVAGNVGFKRTLEKDETPKSLQ